MSGTQTENQYDPATQHALHQVLAKLFGDHGCEVDPTFAELRRRCKDKLRVQDVATAPILQEISTNEDEIISAIRSYHGFFIRGDFLKQHHEFMPQNAVLMRELPANFSETQLMELFQGLQLEDGSPCPVPIPEKIRSEGLAWLAVFSTVEEAQKALVAVRAKTLPDGKNIRAVQRNETARLTPNNQNQNQKRDGMMPMIYPNMGNMSPQYHASHQMYAPMSGSPHAHMYYQQPPAGGAYQPYYAPYVQPAYSMPYGVPMYPVPQPYPVSHFYDMSGYGVMAGQGVQPNMYSGNNVNQANNNANKMRRNNQGQYPVNRSNQPRNRDGAQVRSSRSGDEGLGSPGATATEVAVAALDSHSSVPRSFSADADEHVKVEGHDGQVPVVAIPTSDTVTTADNSAPVSTEESNQTVEESEKPTVEEEPASSSADKDEKGVHQNGRRDGKKDGNNRTSGKPSRDGKNGARDGKTGNRQDKDVKKERKSPPVNLNLEKDFPTLQLGEPSKVAPTGKIAFNYANALKKAQDESPKPTPSPAVAKVSVPQPSNNQSNGKKDNRSGGKGSSPTAGASPTENTASREATSPNVKKVEAVLPATEPVAAVKAVEKPVSIEPVAVVAAAPMPVVETPAVEAEQPVSGGRKTFIDAVRAKK